MHFLKEPSCINKIKGFLKEQLLCSQLLKRDKYSPIDTKSKAIWLSERSYLDKNTLTFSRTYEVKTCGFNLIGKMTETHFAIFNNLKLAIEYYDKFVKEHS